MNTGPIERVCQSNSKVGGLDLQFPLLRLIDRQLVALPKPEQIRLLTNVLCDGDYQGSGAEVLLQALELLFSEKDERHLTAEEALAFRAHLMLLYKDNKDGCWKNDSDSAIRIPALEKILEGWATIGDYSGQVAKFFLGPDAEVCFSFLCNEYREISGHHHFSMEIEWHTSFIKRMEGMFARYLKEQWRWHNLSPWIIKSPDGIASVHLKHRVRTEEVEDLKTEIKFLEVFDPTHRSSAAREFAKGYLSQIKWVDELAQRVREAIEEAILVTKSPKKELVRIEIDLINYGVVYIKVVLPLTKSPKFEPYQDIKIAVGCAVKKFQESLAHPETIEITILYTQETK